MEAHLAVAFASGHIAEIELGKARLGCHNSPHYIIRDRRLDKAVQLGMVNQNLPVRKDAQAVGTPFAGDFLFGAIDKGVEGADVVGTVGRRQLRRTYTAEKKRVCLPCYRGAKMGDCDMKNSLLKLLFEMVLARRRIRLLNHHSDSPCCQATRACIRFFYRDLTYADTVLIYAPFL